MLANCSTRVMYSRDTGNLAGDQTADDEHAAEQQPDDGAGEDRALCCGRGSACARGAADPETNAPTAHTAANAERQPQ